MTSEAVNDEVHASDPSFLSSQNTRLGREGGRESPPLATYTLTHKYTSFMSKTNPSKVE